MDQLQATTKKLGNHLWLSLLVENIAILVTVYVSTKYLNLNILISLILALAVSIVLSYVISTISAEYSLRPLAIVRQAILHLSPSGNEIVKAPKIDNLKLGQELVTNLTGQIYQIASIAEHDLLKTKVSLNQLSNEFIASSMPLPLIVLDEDETITYANHAASEYIGNTEQELIGKNVYMVLDMSFPTESTFDEWLKKVKHSSAIASKSWERVKLDVRDNHPALQFDLAAYYNKSNQNGNSTFLILFDHTKSYSQDDQAISFVALSVHELRTPLTLLRGYIEVFQQELEGKLEPELEDFMNKLIAASEQLTAFVNNILNVARIDDDQMELKLQKENWEKILNHAVESINLRAKVRGIELELKIEPGLPDVGVDRLSIQEVINNIIDNAIKYSGKGTKIIIKSGIDKNGLIETTVQDFGQGIPPSVIPNLFTKYYRDHRNRAQIGGTGLGLYLSKNIVQAHGGNLWVNSIEGQGSTFGFNVLPFDKIKKDTPNDKDQEIVRSAHGWIKNHSYYRR